MKQATLPEVVIEQSVAEPAGNQWRSWIGWVPLALLPMMAMMLRTKLLPWALMWLLAVAIFAGCKWQTWWQARAAGDPGNWKRSAAYFLLWPGMEAREFFAVAGETRSTPASTWLSRVAKTLAGIVLTWAGARAVALGHPLVGGWAGMVGLVLVLHFGTFHLIALAWQSGGLRVKPIMQRPLASHSLSELWGKRWNLGFRKLTHTWVFQPLSKRFGPVAGTLGAFLASGLLHDFVISVPAGAGYGLPTAYFLVQGLGVIAERSETGKRMGLGRGSRGWLWTVLIAAGPLYWLFHPWFVMRVMVPFLRAVVG